MISPSPHKIFEGRILNLKAGSNSKIISNIAIEPIIILILLPPYEEDPWLPPSQKIQLWLRFTELERANKCMNMLITSMWPLEGPDNQNLIYIHGKNFLDRMENYQNNSPVRNSNMSNLFPNYSTCFMCYCKSWRDNSVLSVLVIPFERVGLHYFPAMRQNILGHSEKLLLEHQKSHCSILFLAQRHSHFDNM